MNNQPAAAVPVANQPAGGGQVTQQAVAPSGASSGGGSDSGSVVANDVAGGVVAGGDQDASVDLVVVDGATYSKSYPDPILASFDEVRNDGVDERLNMCGRCSRCPVVYA